MKKVSDLHKTWLKDPTYRTAYDEAVEEFLVAEILIKARQEAAMTQAQVAKKMGTKQASVARMEGGSQSPSISTLKKFAAATGHELQIHFVPSATKVRGAAKKRRVSAKT